MQAYRLLEFPNLHEAVHMRDRKQMAETYSNIIQLATGTQQTQQPTMGSVSRVYFFDWVLCISYLHV